MNFLLMIFLALLMGLVASGIVWYGWGIAENVIAFLRRPRPKPSTEDTESADQS